MNSVFLSIITPVLNAEGTLADTLESVVAQDLSGTEHLLVDARSSDGTLEIASRYPHLTIISEPDRSIYDGMNKGAARAEGSWLLFLQADDWLPEGTLAAYREAIRKYPSAVMITGGAEAVTEQNGKWQPVWSVNDSERKKLTIQNIALGEPMINARLIRKDFFDELGGFSLEYSLASDRDFLLRMACSEGQRIEISTSTYRYRWHSGSSTMTEGNRLTSRLSSENLAIAREYLSHVQGQERKVLKKWHTRLTIQSAMNSLESFQIKGVLSALKEGSAFNPFWTIAFLTEIARSLPGFLARGGKTRSQLLRAE